MFKGFKDFITRGNAMELAVGVVIGAAFTAIVTSLTDNLVNPLVSLAGNPDYSGLGFYLRPDHDPASFVDIGAIITAIINFFLVALVVYFAIVLPMNKLTEAQKRRHNVDIKSPEPTETELLSEIRDLLAKQDNQ